MLHLTLALGDFMLILIGAAMWIGAGIAGVGLLGLGAIGGAAFAIRRHRRER